MAKIRVECSICKSSIWVDMDKKTKLPKEENPTCRNCLNLISRIKQKMIANKRAERKNKEFKPKREATTKEAISNLLRLEQEQPEKLKEFRERKPLNTKESINKNRTEDI